MVSSSGSRLTETRQNIALLDLRGRNTCSFEIHSLSDTFFSPRGNLGFIVVTLKLKERVAAKAEVNVNRFEKYI